MMTKAHIEAYQLHLKGYSYRKIAKQMKHKDVAQGFIAFNLVKDMKNLMELITKDAD